MRNVKVLSVTGELVDTVTDFQNASMYEEINGQYIFSFEAFPADLPRIHNPIYVSGIESFLEVEGQHFVLSRFEKSRNQNARLRLEYEHVSYGTDALKVGRFLPEIMEGTPTDILKEILEVSNTHGTIGTVEFYEPISYKPSGKDLRGCLVELAEGIGAELYFDNYEISLLQRRGADRGLTLEVGVNIKSLTAVFDRDARDMWAYEVDFLDLAHLPDFEEIANAQLGDTVRIIDRELGIDTKERIVSYERDPFNKALPRVQVGKIIPNLFIEEDDEDQDEEQAQTENLTLNFELEMDFETGGITGDGEDDDNGIGGIKNNNVWMEWATVPFASSVTIHFSKKYRQKPSVNVQLYGSSSNPSVTVLTGQVNGQTVYTGVDISSSGSADEITMHAIGRV